MFTRRFTLFRLFGFEVNLDLSWLLLGVLVTWSLALGLFPTVLPGFAPAAYWSMGVVGAVGLLFSIVFHELSHALVARRYGLPIRRITLFVFGGVAEMEQEPRDAKTEFLMAVAGPVASFVLAFVFYEIYRLTTAETPTALHGITYYLGVINFALGLFNLVPGFPLDGGRILRAALWRWRGDFHWATRIASRVGAGFGVALMALGVFAFVTGNAVQGMWWFLIGLFLRAAAAMSYQELLVRESMKGESVRRLMTPNPVTVTPDLPLAALVENYIFRYRHKTYPVVAGGAVLGLVGIDQVKMVPRAVWPSRIVAQVMEPCGANNSVGPETDALEAWKRLSRGSTRRLLVMHEGRLLGILALADVMQFLSLKTDLDRKGGGPGRWWRNARR
ncbi:MAG: site-2 protease family protein [Sulfurifustaceae bacterium]